MVVFFLGWALRFLVGMLKVLGIRTRVIRRRQSRYQGMPNQNSLFIIVYLAAFPKYPISNTMSEFFAPTPPFQILIRLLTLLNLSSSPLAFPLTLFFLEFGLWGSNSELSGILPHEGVKLPERMTTSKDVVVGTWLELVVGRGQTRS